MNTIQMQNLVVTSTRKKGNFKFTEKIKSVTGKSKCCSSFEYIYKFEEFESMLLQKLEYFNDVK